MDLCEGQSRGGGGSLESLEGEKGFVFACHPGVPCFGECCRQLRLMLTPYDVVTLRECLDVSSREFIDRFTTLEFRSPSGAPILYLKMREEGEQCCPFLTPLGCAVYDYRPSACRIYPVARATGCHSVHGQLLESFFLVREGHCRGFERGKWWTIGEWLNDQGVEECEQWNDRWSRILMHPVVRKGLSAHHQQLLYVASYDLDMFRRMVLSDKFATAFNLGDETRELVARDDWSLLDFGLCWLRVVLFGESAGTLKVWERGGSDGSESCFPS